MFTNKILSNLFENLQTYWGWEVWEGRASSPPPSLGHWSVPWDSEVPGLGIQLGYAGPALSLPGYMARREGRMRDTIF